MKGLLIPLTVFVVVSVTVVSVPWALANDLDEGGVTLPPEIAELSVDPEADYTKHYNYDLLPGLDTCGMSWQMKHKRNRTRVKRIVGGRLSKLGKFPWLARLDEFEDKSGNISERCGGSLINSRYVLTAAHCVFGIRSGYSVQSIVFGTVDLRKKRQCVDSQETDCTDERRYDVEDIIIHDRYVHPTLYNDIALIRLSEDVKFDDFVSPICLPTSEKLLSKWSSNRLLVAGYGRTNGDDVSPTYYPSTVREVDMPVVPRSDCDRFYLRSHGIMDKSGFCAGAEYEKGDCKGDSGGPLMKTVKPDEIGEDRVFQFGMVSFGHCAYEGIPGGYTNIFYFMPWILDNIEP